MRSALRNDLARPIDRLLRADHQRAREIVFLADVFEQFTSGCELQIESRRPRRSVCAGIVERDLVFQSVEVQASQTFDEMESVGVREGIAIHPCALIKTDGIYDQGVAFPVTD